MAQNKDMNVFVHGLFGWGESNPVYRYFPQWGMGSGNALKELRRRNGRGGFSDADLLTYRAYLRLLDHIMRVYDLTVCTPAEFALFLDAVGTACDEKSEARRRGGAETE